MKYLGLLFLLLGCTCGCQGNDAQNVALSKEYMEKFGFAPQQIAVACHPSGNQHVCFNSIYTEKYELSFLALTTCTLSGCSLEKIFIGGFKNPAPEDTSNK